MKAANDDFEVWREQQEREKKPFPYVFPQMPPRFQHCCKWFKVLFLLEWSCIILWIFAGVVGCVLMLMKSQAADLVDLIGSFFVALLLLWLVCRMLRHTPKFFWHCPCCKRPFSYYAPSHYSDVLKELKCLQEMEHLHIPYTQQKFCPLVVPSICPMCKTKFFKMPED